MIIVTGASGGIGTALVGMLSGLDAAVVGTFNTREPSGSFPANVTFRKVDVTDPSSVMLFAASVRATATRITLVNLAGLSIDGLAVALHPKDWDRVLDVSLKGSFLMSQAFLKYMIRQKWGRIINVSSVVARTGATGTVAYASAKSGLHGLTRTLAIEYGRYGVLVNSLDLGYIDSGMTHTLSDDQRRVALNEIPLRRFGDVSEIFEAVKWLIASNYVTGTSIRIDGGIG